MAACAGLRALQAGGMSSSVGVFAGGGVGAGNQEVLRRVVCRVRVVWWWVVGC